MKKTITIFYMLFAVLMLTQAQGKKNPPLNKEEFRAKQEAYLAEKAGFTQEEAKAVFPLYFELQDKKAKINDKVWHEAMKGDRENMTDEACEKILKDMANAKIESDKLDLEYIDRYKKVISPKKILMLQKAEVSFHRHMLQIMHRPNNHRDGARKGNRP